MGVNFRYGQAKKLVDKEAESSTWSRGVVSAVRFRNYLEGSLGKLATH